MQETIRQIRTRLRLAMDGAVAASMRQKGVDYKLNFGVTLPRLKEIAADFDKNAALAEELWRQNVRELKILATLLYPAGEFTAAKADGWVSEIRHIEIAEQFCANLMQETPFAETSASAWLREKGSAYIQATGFILYTRLFIKHQPITPIHTAEFLHTAFEVLKSGNLRTGQTALIALKHYGRMAPEQAEQVLCAFEPFQASGSDREREIYDDLQFEFEYYR